VSARVKGETPDWTSDILWVAIYSILLLLLMLIWAAPGLLFSLTPRSAAATDDIARLVTVRCISPLDGKT
jgi:hypothetical protein